MPLFPGWLDLFFTVTLTCDFPCAIAILIDVRRHPPQMAIMAIV
jgi:hypothetical protein